ncbi:MAG TPA: NUDIX hydrolase [Streptosporangiaceae bacterium]|nr:NUDIX hydrolase [Streptosporangiaceae bacterium]
MAYRPYTLPVSVKGVVFENNSVWLRRNERSEWELPGGKIDRGEQPTQALRRELEEELGILTQTNAILQAHIHTIPGSIDEAEGVLIISYLCEVLHRTGPLEHDSEVGKAQFGCFPVEEVTHLTMPSFYKAAVAKAWDLHAIHPSPSPHDFNQND